MWSEREGIQLRTRMTLVAVAALAVVGIACGSGGGDTAGPGAQDNDGSPAAAVGAKEGEHTIVLEVTGAKAADITYGLGADQSQEQGAKVPWKKTLKSSEALIIATVLAQNKGTGAIGCKITIDGKLAKENTSKGQYALVSCTSG